MKNLKKVLSLVLALAMALSLMTVAFAKEASDYTDYGTITNKEAVEVLTALEVIDGMGDSFQPNGNVTRAQMAKMITIISLGNVDPTAFLGTVTDLKDINGHWAEAYIKYCYSQGIISGKGNGIFDPNANVTSAEAAKMLLTAIGYNSDVQGYTGPQWAINVTRDAQKDGLYKGVAVPANQALTRDQAAQMIYNAVDTGIIKATPHWDASTGNTTYSYDKQVDTNDLLRNTFGVATVEAQMTDTVYQTAGANKGTYTATVGGTNYTKVDTDYSALLGQTVKVMFYDKNANGAFNAGDDVVYGIYAKYDSATTDLIVQSGVEATGDKTVKANDVTYTLDGTSIDSWTVAVDGAITSGTTSASSLEDADSTNLIRLVDDDNDGDYDLAIIYTVTFAKVSYADSSRVIAGANTYKTDANVVADTLAKDDFAAVTWNFTEGKTELSEIAKQTGKVTATKTNYVKVDNGDWIYNASGMTVDQTYDYYVLNGVVVDKTQTTAVALESLVFVSDVDSGTVNKNARVYYLDGTTKVVPVDEISTGADKPNAGDLCTVTETDYGVKFNVLGAGDQTAGAVFTDYTYDDASAVAASGGNITTIDGKSIADDAVIFVLAGNGSEESTAKVITGKQLKTLDAHGSNAETINTTAVGSFFKTVNGVAKVTIAAVVWQDDDGDANTWNNWDISEATEHIALVTSDAITVSNGYTQYTIWNGSENLTVVDKDSTAVSEFDLVEYSAIDADGYIKDVARYAHDETTNYSAANGEYTSAALVGFDGNAKDGYTLYLNDAAGLATYVTTDEDTVFWTINSGAETAEEIGLSNTADLTLADEVVDGVYAQNVMVYTAASGKATVVIFDTTNRLADAAATDVAVTDLNSLTVTDADGNVVTTSTVLKVGDILTIKNETGSDDTVTCSNLSDEDGTALSSVSLADGASMTAIVNGTGLSITIS